MNDDDRTSAEHYIFMRVMLAKDSDALIYVKGAFAIIGPWKSFGYQGAKHYGRELGIYSDASPASYSQLHWENKAYIDGINPMHKKYQPGKCQCLCTN